MKHYLTLAQIKATVVYRCSKLINRLRKKTNSGYELKLRERIKYKRRKTTQQKQNVKFGTCNVSLTDVSQLLKAIRARKP